VTTIDLPRPIGFVLGGGGAYGAVQVGMLQALEELAIRPDLVVGTSVGSLNGVMLAQQPQDAVARLADVWSALRTKMIFPGGWFARVRTLQVSRAWVVDHSGLSQVLDQHLTMGDFAELAVPFAAIATDVQRGRTVVIDEGLLRPAVLASAAIPGVFPPVQHAGRVLVDGGLTANVPILQALERGARSLVVLDCGLWGYRDDVPATLLETMYRVAAVTLRQQLIHELPLAVPQVPVVFLPGPFPMQTNPLDFRHSAALMRAAYAAARPFLAVLRVDGPGLYGAPPLLSQ
jgi:NTE family protein